MGKKGLYIHIPFCVKKCNYCAFLSYDVPDAPRREYTDALCNEIRLRAASIRSKLNSSCGVGVSAGSPAKESAERIALDTVYVGGGTPSVLDVSQMRDIMHAVKTSFDIKPDAEITIEVNPGTLGVKDGVTRAKLSAYKSMGFNRLSMGVQSMDNDTLQFLGRIHTAENIARDVRLIREAVFDNLNLDLIFSIPSAGIQKNAEESEGIGNSFRAEEKKTIAISSTECIIDDARDRITLERALEDARKIIALEPEHISCYSLQIEEGTPFARMIERGEISEVPDEEDRETYHAICKLLIDAGYEHYEISNFAKPGYRSRHNSSYWDMSEYIGAGLGASGFACGTRYKNISDLDKYIEAYSSRIAADANGKIREEFEFPHEEEHRNDAFDNISEAVFMGLRRCEGISYDEAIAAYERADDAEPRNDRISAKERFREIFKDAWEEAAEFAQKGLLAIDDRGIRLTEQGIDISNTIMALFV